MHDFPTHYEPSAPSAEENLSTPSFGINLEDGDYLKKASERNDHTNELIRQHQELKEKELTGFSDAITSLLEKFLSLGKLDGLTIASEDGLVIAETYNLKNAEIMVAIGSMFEYAAQRAQSTGIVSKVDEMTVHGVRGELAVVRYFPNLKRRFFLMAYAQKQCSYRRITNLALRQCGALLEDKFEKSQPNISDPLHDNE